MTTPAVTLHGFAYGEHVDGVAARSLGFRLLSPQVPEPWSAEVEALARHLQAAPYPDDWEPVELFCSALLADGRRVVALARYGLTDHTRSHRRGGLELVGVVGPAQLDVAAAVAVYHWLRRRRAVTEELPTFGGTHDLTAILADAPPPPAHAAVPVLPVRLWQEGALLFAAAAPADADQNLGLLGQAAAAGWQWLPLVGPDFPLHTYAQRGSLIAWTPPAAGPPAPPGRAPVEAPPPRPVEPSSPWRLAMPALLGLLAVLLLINLLTTFTLLRRQADSAASLAKQLQEREAAGSGIRLAVPPAPDQFAEALHDALRARTAPQEWELPQDQLLARYEMLARDHPRLRIEGQNTKGKLALGMVQVLAERGGGRLQEVVKKALANKGYDARLIQAACEAIQRQLTADTAEGGSRP